MSLEWHECTHDGDTLLYSCGAWAVSVTWAVSGDVVSRVYLIRLVRSVTSTKNSILGFNVSVHYFRFSYPDEVP